MSSDIVISGMGARLPESNNTDQYWKNLIEGVDCVTNREDRWPEGLYGMSDRMGRISSLRNFDRDFFSMMPMTDRMEPRSAFLLETVYETIIDAGLNVESLRGSNTGVYVAMSVYRYHDGLTEEMQPDRHFHLSQYSFEMISNANSFIANRVSFVFDFKGPSMVLDTACSSSGCAIVTAINGLLLGQTEYAIVCGSNLNFEPMICKYQEEIGMCSPRGVSAVLDETADGFVKADGIACVLLQRRSTAKRVYATVRSARMNEDGFKKLGQFFPSSEAQQALMTSSYQQCDIDPSTVNYIEGHLTGTKVGDLEEIKAIYNAYCAQPGRKEPLIIGAVKSNIGHCEGCSGLASLIKVCLTFENECLPPILNLKNMKHEIKEFCPPLRPNTEAIPYKPGLAAVNNFGVGGVNVHILIEPNHKTGSDDSLRIAEEIPRIVNICGRTEEAVKHVMDFIQNNPNKVNREFLALLADTMKCKPHINSAGFPFRGSMIITKTSEDNEGIKYEYKRRISENKSKTVRPLWFLFPGLGGQWTAMAKALMPIEIFRNKVKECHQIMQEFGVDLKHLLLSEDTNAISTMTAKCCSTTAIEICLYEVLKAMDISPDGIIGHSFGEIACAYADGCLTTREAMITTYLRGYVTENDKQIPKGLMAVCGISKNEAKKVIRDNVVIACNNAKNTVVLSGPEKPMIQIMNDLKAKNVFVFQLESSDIPYHNSLIKTSAKPMADEIRKHLPNPRLRSKKWISTSILEEEPEEDILNYASAEYFVNNLISPIFFYDKFKSLPTDAIVVEVGPHGVFRKIVSDTLKSATYMTLIKKNSNDTNLDNLLSVITQLYELGINPSVENLYPKVEFPVSRGTPSIGSLIQWDHSKKLNLSLYPEKYCRTTSSDMNYIVDLKMEDDKNLAGHCVDGLILFPATAYLMLAWRIYAASLGKIWNQVPVVFEHVQFQRPVLLDEDSPTKLKVVFSRNTDEFTIYEDDNLCCHGKVHGSVGDWLLFQYELNQSTMDCENEIILSKDDIYKDFRVRGYDYSGEFQKLSQIRTNDFQTLRGECEWNADMVSFLDGLLQSQLLCLPQQIQILPVMIRCLRVDPKILFDTLKNNRVSDIEKRMNSADFFKDITEQNFQGEQEERFHLFKSWVPFCFDANTGILVAPGVEVENLIGYPIIRKMPKNLVLNSYEWIANEDNNAINDCDKQYITQYLEVCKTMLKKLKAHGLNGLKCDFECEDKTSQDSDVIERQRHDNREHKIMLRILDKLSETDDNGNVLYEQKLKEVLSDRSLDMSRDVVNEVSKNERLIRTLIDIVSENNATKNEYKVTEVNLTGDVLINEVKSYIVYSKYRPTDVDYKLLVRSVDKIDETLNAVQWDGNSMPKLELNDIIIYRDSYELWHLNSEMLVKHFDEAIVENGFFIIVAKYRLTEPEEAINSLIINEMSVSHSDLENRIESLIKTCEKSSLQLIARKLDSISTMTLMFRKVTENNRKIPENSEIIEVKEQRDEKWFEEIREALQRSKDALDSGEKPNNVWLIARDTDINGIVGLVNSLRLEPGGECIRCLFDMDSKLQLPINWTAKPFSDILANDLVINIIRDGKLGTYRHLKLPKDYDKTVSNQYFLNQGVGKDVSSLTWFDIKSLTSDAKPCDWFGNPIELLPVNIYSSGLVFKDVMFATGRIPTGTMGYYSDCMIGSEFAGRRADTGERVMGFTQSRGIATDINANSDWLTTIPNHWSMSDAVTVISNYLTLWYGLIRRAGLQKGESILIHSGAGGIGQSAINICKHYECDIYVTIGNEEKKKFIVNEFAIPESHVFSSRDVQFKYKIMKLTKGRGIDIVINSLTGEKLDASYDLLKDCGRFVEIGKYDMVQNKQIGMFDFLKDISFIGVSMDVGLMKKPLFAQEFFQWMHKNSLNGCVKPYNKIVFNANEADKAFRYMTTGKHIGKIVIRIRDEEESRGRVRDIRPAKDMTVNRKTYFNPNKVYIIIGGLGGMGLQLIQWMISLGARKFLVTSRNGIKTFYQEFFINRLRKYGEQNKFFEVMIEVSKNDCLTVESAQQVIKESENMGQIGGIFHLGLVLDDCLIEEMSYKQFCDAIDCKYNVFDVLDKLSRKLDYHLDYFVVFSSIACGRGNSGQTNYAFGNSLCERICEQRRRDGLHGLAVQYGPVGDVGVLENSSQVIELSTLQKQRINSCCEVLDKYLSCDQPVVTSWVNIYHEISNDNQKKKLIRLFEVLGIDPETTPKHLTLGDIGLESMLAIEMQKELERGLNIKLNINQIKTITIGLINEYENGNKDKVKSYMNGLKKAQQILSSHNFTIPNEPYIKLNSVTKGRPIYFMPPLEITFSAYESFAQKFDRPVIGLNWTRDCSQCQTMKDINQYFTELLKKLEPKGDIDLIGSLDGALVLAKQMMKGRLRRGVIIDVIKERILKENVSEETIFEFLFEFMSSEIPDEFSDKIYRSVLAESNISGKIKRLSDELKDFCGRGLIAPDLEEILRLMLKRVNMLLKYRLDKRSKFGNTLKERIGKKWAKKSGKLRVIKAFKSDKVDDVDEHADRARQAYLLPDDQESNDVLSVEAVDYHNSFNITSDEIGNRIIEAIKD